MMLQFIAQFRFCVELKRNYAVVLPCKPSLKQIKCFWIISITKHISHIQKGKCYCTEAATESLEKYLQGIHLQRSLKMNSFALIFIYFAQILSNLLFPEQYFFQNTFLMAASVLTNFPNPNSSLKSFNKQILFRHFEH